MTAEPPRDEIRNPRHGFRVPWLALAGVAATIVAASTLVVGIGDTLSTRESAGRLLPLEAASPSPTASPPPSGTPDPAITPDPWSPAAEPSFTETPDKPDPPPDPPPERRIRDALFRLRSSVYLGVAAGDVRDDVGLDLTNVIENILDRPWSPLDRRRADIASLQQKISTRTREGGISDRRAETFRRILDGAEV
ncbi:hypothetical protein [Actinomadura monticuli]|uniref:Uncharacterized protein n=1 Tax=Actinomadura monticuli TaxID=3097367 RepID=A0ABV4QFH4_9ACTN